VDKSVLIQYISLKAEIADLEERIQKLRKEIGRMEGNDYQVSDSVKGTRRDGTYGSIRITGYPYQLCQQKRWQLKRREYNLTKFQAELLELINEVDDYINGLEDSRMRRMLRHKYLDELSWVQVAHRMGRKYTADGCRKQVERFLQEK